MIFVDHSGSGSSNCAAMLVSTVVFWSIPQSYTLFFTENQFSKLLHQEREIFVVLNNTMRIVCTGCICYPLYISILFQ